MKIKHDWSSATNAFDATAFGSITKTYIATTAATTHTFTGLRSILASGTLTTTAAGELLWTFIPPEARRAMQEAIIDCSVLSLKRRYEAA